MWQVISSIFPYAIAYTMPLLITALGGLYSERSGVVNIGLDGLMIVGSFAGALVIWLLQAIMPGFSIWIGLIAAIIAGMLFATLHAVACINLNANQVISGTAINMIAGALLVFLARNITGSGNIDIQGFPRTDVPVLSQIPVAGKLFFTNTYPTTWLVLIILVASWFLLFKTPFGLRLRACGEHPQAAEAAGIDVVKMRYFGVLMSGACAGLGGAVNLVTYSSQFNGMMSEGLGFLALAALIFGQWKPLGILGATLFFGTARTIANVSQVMTEFQGVPVFLLKSFPYIITIIALILFSKKTHAPRAAGEIYDRGRR